MQYYTKQQLQGSGKYNSHCRIGNWNEDLEMEENLLKDYLSKKESGQLKIDLFQQKMNKALAPVDLVSVKVDGYIHFGDVVQICQSTTGSVLACDTGEKMLDVRDEISYAVTASTSTDPCVRNTFSIVKYKSPKASIFEQEYDDNKTLHYGEKIKLMHVPGPNEEPLFLYSKPISTTNFAKFSHNQEVALTHRDTFDSVWTVLHPNAADRLNMQNTAGLKVPVGKAIVLQHCATAQNLCLMPQFKFQNDFGSEMEVCAKTQSVLGKTLTMEKIMQGKVSGDLEKPGLPNNFWVFISSSIQGSEPVEATAEPPAVEASASQVLDSIVQQLEGAYGKEGVAALQAKLSDMDRENTGSVLPEDLLLALNHCKVTLTNEDFEELINLLKMNKESENVEWAKLIDAVGAYN